MILFFNLQVCKVFINETRQPASPASLPLLLSSLNLLNRVIFDGLLLNSALREPAVALVGDTELMQFCENVVKESARAQSKNAPAQSSARDKLLLAALTFHHLWLYGNAVGVASVHSVPPAAEPFEKSSAVGFGELLQILQSGPSAACLVASSCLVERVSDLVIRSEVCHESGSEQHGISPPSGTSSELTRPQMRALVLVLHNLLSADDGLVRRNGFRCLAVLCQAGRVALDARRAASHSPWNRLLAQDFVASVSAASGFAALEAAPLMTSFLRMAPRPKWVVKVLTPGSCSRVVDWVCSAKQLSPELVEMLCGLREGGFLGADDVCKLQALFQVCPACAACCVSIRRRVGLCLRRQGGSKDVQVCGVIPHPLTCFIPQEASWLPFTCALLLLVTLCLREIVCESAPLAQPSRLLPCNCVLSSGGIKYVYLVCRMF